MAAGGCSAQSLEGADVSDTLVSLAEGAPHSIGNTDHSTSYDDQCEDGVSEDQPAWLSEANLRSAFHLNYEVTRVLGCGTFGRVYEVKARDHQDEVYVAKVCDVRVHAEAGIREEYNMLMLASEHKNCVQVIEAYFEDPYSYIIVEKCSRSFVRAITRHQLVSEDVMAFYFRQAFRALEAIHSARIVHRDVKMDNLMVEGETVKLIDFGQATNDIEGGHRGVCGTAPFMSPEMVRGDGYGVATDVWSLGVCMYVCMLGDFPYKGLVNTSTVMKAAIRLGVPPPAFRFTGKVARLQGPAATLSANADGLLRAILQRRPERRPAADEALRRAWFEAAPPSLPGPAAACASTSNVDLKVCVEAAFEVGAFSKSSVKVNQQMDQDMIDLQDHASDFIIHCSTTENARVG